MKTGLIYKIELTENNIYIGSTKQTLCKRQSQHNNALKTQPHQKLYKSCIENNITNIKCVWVADVTFNNIAELRMVEEKYRKELNANLNTIKCYTSEDRKEYYKNNKDTINKKQKEYYENNKNKKKEYYEKNKEYNKEYYEEYNKKNKEKIKCDNCDCMISKYNLIKHQKTNKCKLMSECIFSDSD